MAIDFALAGGTPRRLRTRRRRLLRRALRTSGERSTYDVLRLAHLAVSPLREGLAERPAVAAARAIRSLLDVGAVALADAGGVIAYHGVGARHHPGGAGLEGVIGAVFESGRPLSVGTAGVCREPACAVGESVGLPIKVGNDVVAVLVLVRIVGSEVTLGLLRAGREVARMIGVQLALAEGDRARQELVRAQTEALRAQISPHFAYNTLTAASSLVRRDPERARELLVQFAEFLRYILRNDRLNTTLSDELQNVHTYLELERARHGDRLEVLFQIDPGVLPVVVPVLILQPLVENAVQHGMEGVAYRGVISIVGEDRDDEVYVAVSDTGPGMDPLVFGDVLEGRPVGGRIHLGLRNVNERLRTTYGERYRLVLESVNDSGTTVSFSVPKYRAGVTP